MQYPKNPRISVLFLLLAALFLLSSAAGAVTNTYEPFEMTILPGETGEIHLILASAPSGLSGYSLNIRIGPEGGAAVTAVTFPAWAGLSQAEGVPGQELRLMAVDMEGEISGNAEDVLLATLTIPGVSTQPLSVSVYDFFYDDEEGVRMIPPEISATVTGIGEGVTPPPTQQESPGPAETAFTSPTPGTTLGSVTPAVPAAGPGQGAQGHQYTLGLVTTVAPDMPAAATGTTVAMTTGVPAGQRAPFASLPGMAGVLAILSLMGLWLRKSGGRE